MTPAQIKKWFAEQSKVTAATIDNSRRNLNLSTSSKLRPLRTVDQSMFAELSGIDRSHLSHLESGKRNWSAKTVAKYLAGVAKQ